MYNVYRIVFTEGKECTWITDQCSNIEDAVIGAIERFGKKRIKHVVDNSQQAEIKSTTCANLNEES